MNLALIYLPALILLITMLLAASPYLMPPTECFSVSVPPSAKSDPEIRLLYRRYAAVVVCAGLACSAATSILTSASTTVVATLVPILVAFAAMLRARAQVQALKERKGWHARAKRSVAALAETDTPQPIALVWNILYLVLVVVLTIVTLANYEYLPERIPMQTELNGVVTRYADKSLGTSLFPVAVTAFLGAIFTVAHWMIMRSKKPIDPASPATSALAYGRFARAQSILLLVGGLSICTAIGTGFLLSSLGTITPSAAGNIVLLATAAFLIAEIVLAVVQGQAGARLAAELRTNDVLARDDDAYWLLGNIYYNAEDPSFVVPKRFGVGWTINVASRRAWLVLGGIVLISAIFTIATKLTVG